MTAALAGLVAAGGVRGQGQNQASGRRRAVATFSVLGDLVKNVGGERIEVTTLVGANGDVHVYAPTPRDAKTIATADIVFVNGLGLEGWLERLVGASAPSAPVVVSSNGIKPRRRMGPRDRVVSDPHAWQSVANAKIYVGNIRDGLIAVDAAEQETFAANAAAYLSRLDALDGEIKAAIAAIPPGRRKAITAHDAFGYFGDEYGVQFIAVEGLSTDAEPSARELARLIEQIRREKITALFVENVSDPRLLQRIADETGVRIGGKLYSDALSPPDGPAASYVAMMRSNLHELTRALMP
jgi:zinc/manganese transport system substrate-binding protein